jgi:hypothetical protein
MLALVGGRRFADSDLVLGKLTVRIATHVALAGAGIDEFAV